jgi:ATP-dependent Clp endopeptidase proteolytic subunit ClpP
MAKSKIISEPKKLYVQKAGTEASVFLYGLIGDCYAEDADKNITDLDFIKTLEELKTQGVIDVHLRINSPGGYTSDGLAIITSIKNSDLNIHTWNDGRAYSMAADIWLCVPVERRHMSKNSSLMIHAPSTGCYGTAKDMREMADQLDTIAEATIQMMVEATGKDAETIRKEFYDYADHNLTYQQCVEYGLINDDGSNGYATEVTKTKNEPMKAAFFKYASQKRASINRSDDNNDDSLNKNNDDMTTEALKQAFADGTLNLSDVETIIAEEKAKQPLSTGVVKQLIAEAVAPFRAENDALKVQIDELKLRTLGTPPPPTGGSSAESDNDPDQTKKSAEMEAFERRNTEYIRQVQTGQV